MDLLGSRRSELWVTRTHMSTTKFYNESQQSEISPRFWIRFSNVQSLTVKYDNALTHAITCQYCELLSMCILYLKGENKTSCHMLTILAYICTFTRWNHVIYKFMYCWQQSVALCSFVLYRAHPCCTIIRLVSCLFCILSLCHVEICLHPSKAHSCNQQWRIKQHNTVLIDKGYSQYHTVYEQTCIIYIQVREIWQLPMSCQIALAYSGYVWKRFGLSSYSKEQRAHQTLGTRIL